MTFFSKEWRLSGWFLLDRYAEAFYPNVLCNIESLNNPIEDYTLVRSNNDRPHSIESDEGLNLRL
jgi:hypothetical protein